MAEHHRKNRADRHDPADGQVLVRMPAELMARVRTAAAERDVPVAWIVRQLVADGIKRLRPADEMLLLGDDEAGA